VVAYAGLNRGSIVGNVLDRRQASQDWNAVLRAALDMPGPIRHAIICDRGAGDSVEVQGAAIKPKKDCRGSKAQAFVLVLRCAENSRLAMRLIAMGGCATIRSCSHGGSNTA